MIAHEISYNPERERNEICIRLEDVKPSGVTFASDVSPSDASAAGGWVNYARPFVDDNAFELVLEVSGESTIVNLQDMRADFHGLTKARVSSLLQVVANKMNLPTNAPLGLMMLSGGQSETQASPGHTPLSEDRVKIAISRDADVMLDGEVFETDWTALEARARLKATSSRQSDSFSDDEMDERAAPAQSTFSCATSNPTAQHSRAESLATATARLRTDEPLAKKRKRTNTADEATPWTIRRGLWRLRVQSNPDDVIRGGLEVVFVAVKLDAYSGEKARNTNRSFLS